MLIVALYSRNCEVRFSPRPLLKPQNTTYVGKHEDIVYFLSLFLSLSRFALSSCVRWKSQAGIESSDRQTTLH